MIRLLKDITIAGLLLTAGSCQKKIDIPEWEPAISARYTTSPVKKIFGFEGERKYAYCPSIIIDGADRHLWFCGNDPDGEFHDQIYYIHESPSGVSQPSIVLAPGNTGEWDDRHVCDPSVIEGDFNMNGVNYKYALFFLGNKNNRYYNEVGVAFSNSLTTNDWVKYPGPLVPKTWEGDQDLQYEGSNGQLYTAWGVGQPSVVSLDQKGKVLITYTVGDQEGTRTLIREADLSDMNQPVLGTPVKMATSGLTQMNYTTSDIAPNADFAVDANTENVYMVRHVQPAPSNYPNYIPAAVEVNMMNYNEFLTGGGVWKRIVRIDESVSGYPRNHNAALARNAFGITTGLENMEVYFTISKAQPDVSATPDHHAEWTYTIFKTSIQPK
ncbi:glycoside hydrolase family protein [Gynurincola endophyticus]|uniref:sugar-binding protein n=1 Tax=Gynurincola endophyticus TaxID=2479004 RepID=UPI000F8CE967|nr:sugar-binding protein [Gynurincola endophyticus]